MSTEKKPVKKKFTLEIEVDEESNARYYGEDMLYILLDYIGRGITEIGYDRGFVRYHNGRNSREFDIQRCTHDPDLGPPAEIEERK